MSNWGQMFNIPDEPPIGSGFRDFPIKHAVIYSDCEKKVHP